MEPGGTWFPSCGQIEGANRSVAPPRGLYTSLQVSSLGKALLPYTLQEGKHFEHLVYARNYLLVKFSKPKKHQKTTLTCAPQHGEQVQ